MNPYTDLKPGDKLISCGFDFSWCFVIYEDHEDYDGYKIGSNAKIYSCWKVRAKRGNGHSGTERYKSNQWEEVGGCVQKTTGYYGVSMRNNEGKRHLRLTHALMLEAFYGKRGKGWESCHNNGIRTDNRFVNIRWGTNAENQADRARHGTSNRGSRHGLSKLNEKDVENIRRWKNEGVSVKEIVTRLGGKVKVRAVYTVLEGSRWSY